MHEDMFCEKLYYVKKCQKFKKVFFHFYFFNSDFSFAFQNQCTIFYLLIHNDPAEGSVSQNFDLGLSYFLMI